MAAARVMLGAVPAGCAEAARKEGRKAMSDDTRSFERTPGAARGPRAQAASSRVRGVGACEPTRLMITEISALAASRVSAYEAKGRKGAQERRGQGKGMG